MHHSPLDAPLKNIDHDVLDQAIGESSLMAVTGSFAANVHSLYDVTLRDNLDRFAPKKTLTITVRTNSPWINNDIIQAKRLRRKCESTWRRTGLQVHRDLYTNQRDSVNSMIQKAKVQYYQDKILECEQDQKSLFKIDDGLRKCTPKQTINLSECHDAADFNCFFLEKISNIHAALDKCTLAKPSHADPNPRCTASFDNFTAVTQEEVINVVNKSPSKTSSLDPWPTWMVKAHMSTLAPVIQVITNTSLTTGVFPSEWKKALVNPLLKKPKLDPTVLSNYRPVSNLQFVSKVVERVVAKQLTSFLQNNNLYPKFQSAYRARHSTETALLRVQNDILCAIDNQQGVILILLDLSAAFDCISHKILLERLHHRFGISGTALEWLTDYLSDRSQSVMFNGEISSPIAVPHGVPQGSVLGPILFSLYTAPICDIISLHGLNFHLYADDTQVYMTFKFNTSPTVNETMARAQLCVTDIHAWMVTNKMKLNADKTELMVLTSPRVRHRVLIPDFYIMDAPISASPIIRNLGSMWDQSASMAEHIKFICRNCYFHLHNIAAVRHMLTRAATEKVVHAFISTRLDSCNSLLLNVPAGQIAKLQRIQNCAARIVLRQRKSDSITAALKELHWLPVHQRIRFKVLCLTYQCVNGMAPAYLCELVSPYVQQRNLRSNNQLLLQQPAARTASYGDRAFAVSAPRLWNVLPATVKLSDTYEVFKKKLKTHLFTSVLTSQTVLYFKF
jgi:hypothetical protein